MIVQQEGFRLSYVEIYNWGTFDGKIWKLQPNGKNSLLTGANGSGKTTLVDAILTLLVPPNKRHYNQSSGAESKRERDENSYVLGAYGTLQSEGGLAAKTKYLRSKNDFSILLGVFFNAETKEYLTLAQSRWYSDNDMKRSYMVAATALTIEEHFLPFDTGGVWRQRLKKKIGAEEFDSFTKYALRFSKTFGFKSEKALVLFAQTVGIKVLGNLNEFIRTNMLEENDAETEFSQLRELYDNLLTAHKAIEKAREQAALLEPILENSQNYHTATDELTETQELQDLIAFYFAQQKVTLYGNAQQELDNDILRKNNQIEDTRRMMNELGLQRDELTISISGNKAYEQLQQLERNIKQTEEDGNNRQKRANGYNKLGESLNWKRDPTEKQFYQGLEDAKKGIAQAEADVHILEDKEFEIKTKCDQTQQLLVEQKAHLNSLLQRKNRVPIEQINIREQLIKKLNIAESNLPFVAELIRATDTDWEPAIERLFRNLGLTLLVKEEHVDAVSRYMQQNNLEGKIAFEKMSKIVIARNEATEGGKKLDKSSILQKIEIKKGTDFTTSLEVFLHENYNFRCVEGVAELQRYPLSLTGRGLIKLENQYEKDDSVAVTTKDRYILGWDNRETILAAQRTAKATDEQVQDLNRQIRQSKTERNALQTRRDTLTRLLNFEIFAEIDWKTSTKTVQDLKAQKENLSKSSNQLQTLQQQLETVKRDIEQKDKERERFFNEKSRLETRLESYIENIKTAEEFLSAAPLSKNIDWVKYRPKIEPLLDGKEPSISNIASLEPKVTKQIAEIKERKQKDVANLERRLTLDMQRFISPNAEILAKYPNWSADVLNLKADIGYLKEFEDFHKKLSQEDLPKHQKRFKEWLNERLIFDIANFKTSLENKESLIQESIEEINASLRDINFNAQPQTYIELDIHKSRDVAIRDFRQMLRDAMPDPAKLIRNEDTELESSFIRIKTIIEELSSNETWRKKVTDVRNWLEFAAIERYRADDQQRQYYVDSQSLSGGEKAKLAYTILASAIAYQFGIRNEDTRKKSFRFAVVDEAFSKVDPENAVYAMELFKQLNLQLMVVTPLDKINLAEPYIHSVHYVENREKKNSVVYDLPMKVYYSKKEEFAKE
jgi:uncharacterized protein YPO0396